MLIDFAHVSRYVFDVTDEQIGRCHAILEGSKKFYMVESEQDNFVEYKVTLTKEWGFRCTCKSGEYGFANVRHISGVCKHVRWAVAAMLEEITAMAEQAELNAFQRQDTMELPAVKATWDAQAKREVEALDRARKQEIRDILWAKEESRKPYHPERHDD